MSAKVLHYRPSPSPGRRRASLLMALLIAAGTLPQLALGVVAGEPVLLRGPREHLALVALAGAALELALLRGRRGDAGALRPALILATVLATAHFGLEGTLALEAWARGAEPGPARRGLHAAQAGLGLAGLGWLAVRAVAGAYPLPRRLPVRLWALHWHAVTATWLALYLAPGGASRSTAASAASSAAFPSAPVSK